jgi:choline dehydrogenase-like flavoprotein
MLSDIIGTLEAPPKHGGDRSGEQGSDATLLMGRGRGYLAARIKLDHPDIVERINEFPGIRAATGAYRISSALAALRLGRR